jgi:hypothetical protein
MNLFDPKPVRPTDPETSHRAEQGNRPRRPSQKQRILAYLRDHGPACPDAWEAELGIPHGPRATGLRRAGLIEKTGNLVQTRFGADSEEYRITELGKTYLEGGK